MDLSISPEKIAIGVVSFIILMKLASFFFPKPTPKESTFRCARCNATAKHNERTIEAWRNHKTKFYCHACHKQWLQSQPTEQRQALTSSKSTGGGCLSMVLVLIAIPAIISVWSNYA